MKFIAYGLNHTTAPIEVREKFALSPEKAQSVIQGLKSKAPEAVFLSTCNRVEFYFSSPEPKKTIAEILKTLSTIHKLKPSEIKKYFYLYEDLEAYSHLFRVAGSLDSMVVGEAQILGQVKEAYEISKECGMAGTLLNGVFSRAFGAAKKIRSQTQIARMPTNISSVAVDMAKKIFSSLDEHQVLILGAGEMSELTAKYLRDSGVGGFFIANRTFDKAKALASKLGGTALSLSDGIKKIAEVDIVLTSVGGEERLLQKEEIERMMKLRGGRSLFIIDLGVPRNVDPDVGKVGSVYLYNIDNLSTIADANREQRIKAVESAEVILEHEIQGLCHWLSSLDLVPTIVRLREDFERVRKQELEKFTQKNTALSEAQKAAIERLTRDMIGKLLHAPSTNLKNIDSEIDRLEFARMLNNIFSLADQPENK